MLDETTMTFEEVCAEIRSLLAEHPQERWIWSLKEGDHATLTAWVGDHIAKHESRELSGIVLDDEPLRDRGESAAVCFTGNGPSSEKHARLLMLVRGVLPELLDRATRVHPLAGTRHG